MTPLQILIVEDEFIIAEDLKIQLTKLGYKVTGITKSYKNAVHILKEQIPDLILIDIKLKGEKDGIDLAQFIRNNYQIPLIFITSHADTKTVQRAKEVNPDGYLVKPFEGEDLYTSIEIAVTNFISHKSGLVESKNLSTRDNAILEDSIFVRKDHLLVKIRFDDLAWIKSERNYLELHCCGNKHLIRATLKDFLDKLPEKQFMQIHRSYAVNLKHISAIEYTAVRIEDEEIPLGRSFFEPLKERLRIIT